MWKSDPVPTWDAVAHTVNVGMARWREEHPQANLLEMEREIDRRVAAWRGQTLQDMALASAVTRLQEVAPEARPGCIECGGRVVVVGMAERRLTAAHDGLIVLERATARCSVCGTEFSPPG